MNDGWVTFIPLMADIFDNQKQAAPIIVTLISVSFYSSSALLNFFVGHFAGRSGSQGKMMASGIAILSLSFLASTSLSGSRATAALLHSGAASPSWLGSAVRFIIR